MGVVSSNPEACTWSRRPNFVRKGGFLVVERVLRPYRRPRHCWALNPQKQQQKNIYLYKAGRRKYKINHIVTDLWALVERLEYYSYFGHINVKRPTQRTSLVGINGSINTFLNNFCLYLKSRILSFMNKKLLFIHTLFKKQVWIFLYLLLHGLL